MKSFQVNLKSDRVNRDTRCKSVDITAYSLREAINKAKLQAFMSTSVPIKKWSLKWAIAFG